VTRLNEAMEVVRRFRGFILGRMANNGQVLTFLRFQFSGSAV
jgi:hypothetical protein